MIKDSSFYSGSVIDEAKWYLSIPDGSVTAKQLAGLGVNLEQEKQWAREVLGATDNDNLGSKSSSKPLERPVTKPAS